MVWAFQENGAKKGLLKQAKENKVKGRRRRDRPRYKREDQVKIDWKKRYQLDNVQEHEI